MNFKKGISKHFIDKMGPLKLGHITCFENKIVCNIIAIEEKDEVLIFYGIDSKDNIHFGPRDKWGSIWSNYEIFREFALKQKVFNYKKHKAKQKIIEYLSEEPHATYGSIK